MSIQLNPAEILALFRRYPGTQREIAVKLGVRDGSVSSWLHGRLGSKRIEQACRERAQQLIEKELQAA